MSGGGSSQSTGVPLFYVDGDSELFRAVIALFTSTSGEEEAVDNEGEFSNEYGGTALEETHGGDEEDTLPMEVENGTDVGGSEEDMKSYRRYLTLDNNGMRLSRDKFLEKMDLNYQHRNLDLVRIIFAMEDVFSENVTIMKKMAEEQIDMEKKFFLASASLYETAKFLAEKNIQQEGKPSVEKGKGKAKAKIAENAALSKIKIAKKGGEKKSADPKGEVSNPKDVGGGVGDSVSKEEGEGGGMMEEAEGEGETMVLDQDEEKKIQKEDWEGAVQELMDLGGLKNRQFDGVMLVKKKYGQLFLELANELRIDQLKGGKFLKPQQKSIDLLKRMILVTSVLISFCKNDR